MPEVEQDTSVDFPAGSTSFYKTVNAQFPDLSAGRAIVSPPRNGVDRNTGKLLQGWSHVEQSLEIIMQTGFHERVLRRWVGSFVPHILGESVVERVVTRFYWAIITAIDLWEPNYRVKQVHTMGDALDNGLIDRGVLADVSHILRAGEVIFRQEGVYYPRGHLGDYTPSELRNSELTGRGGNLWDAAPTTRSA